MRRRKNRFDDGVYDDSEGWVDVVGGILFVVMVVSIALRVISGAW